MGAIFSFASHPFQRAQWIRMSLGPTRPSFFDHPKQAVKLVTGRYIYLQGGYLTEGAVGEGVKQKEQALRYRRR